MVALSGILTWRLKWREQAVQVLGYIQTGDISGLPFHWPFTFKHIHDVTILVTTAFLRSLLGVFKSSLTAQSLRKASSGKSLTSLRINSDQELTALGAANVIGGCILALPSFGGYGRSKLNFPIGGRTPMSNVLLSAMTLICNIFTLPVFYYLPREVLSAMIAVVGVSMIEECLHEVALFAKIWAWPELALITLVFGATIFHSVSLGMALGIGWSIVTLLTCQGWRCKINVFDPCSSEAHENAEIAQIATLCGMRTLLVTTTGPMTFANTSNLKDRIDDLEHTFMPALPSSPHSEPESETKTATALVFDTAPQYKHRRLRNSSPCRNRRALCCR